ncbi:YggS family pyridoxal phosphate-dependent enzyme [Lachnospira sp.]|jgi:pyridoxal phosphate enzyme (YggS family)|uniref:YggS family pyridoxal phosphate-dependent enzyme n=1 Tax=Lachnospira sp. TaxID=2049031 RepID=UPI00257B8827|nr:YggS family pyridoxal phosphate-dependent enzyme [Lachnospira sp.]
MVVENYKEVLENVKKAALKAGRDPKDITVLAVSKTKPNEMIEELYNEGVREFGENYVQELATKMETLPKDIHWHMIGHLQRNKIKYIIENVKMIHSVDSLRLAKAISDEAVKKGVNMDILLEVNVALEENKFGFKVEEVEEAVKEIAKLPNICVKGLMTSAPYVSDAEENRQYFKRLNKLLVDINDKNIDNVSMSVLSMGMTNDYLVAIEEGATHVRVGTAIFGERNYNK